MPDAEQLPEGWEKRTSRYTGKQRNSAAAEKPQPFVQRNSQPAGHAKMLPFCRSELLPECAHQGIAVGPAHGTGQEKWRRRIRLQLRIRGRGRCPRRGAVPPSAGEAQGQPASQLVARGEHHPHQGGGPAAPGGLPQQDSQPGGHL